jgi:hypothetical protein
LWILKFPLKILHSPEGEPMTVPLVTATGRTFQNSNIECNMAWDEVDLQENQRRGNIDRQSEQPFQ